MGARPAAHDMRDIHTRREWRVEEGAAAEGGACISILPAACGRSPLCARKKLHHLLVVKGDRVVQRGRGRHGEEDLS